MNARRWHPAAMVLALFCATAMTHAQPNTPGLLGVELQTKFTLDDCPKGGPGVQFPPVCASASGQARRASGKWGERYEVMMDPDRKPDWVRSLTVVVEDGQVVELILRTDGLKYQVATLEAATKRLGQPRDVVKRSWIHPRLGKVDSILASWGGSTWSATFDSVVSGRVDEGLLLLKSLEAPAAKPAPPL